MTTPAPDDVSWRSRFGWPLNRGDKSLTDQQLDEGAADVGSEPGSNEFTDAAFPERPSHHEANGRSDDALGKARGSRADWDRLPPTDHQIRYIRVLGGDPADAQTKAEASELIDRLRRLRGPSPLDPYDLEKRGRKAGSEAGVDWKSAHDSLLSGLRLDLQQYIDSTLDSLRAKLSDACGPGGVRQTFGPQNLVREARVRLEQLRVWRQHGERDGVPMPDMSPPSMDHVDSREHASERGVNRIVARDALSDSNQSSSAKPLASPNIADLDIQKKLPWWQLFFVIALCVAIESVFNIELLRQAVRGGALEAFMLAILVSCVNVGGLGVGAGLLFSWLRRQPHNIRYAQPVLFAVWVVVAIGFNLIAGRHREAYAHVAESQRVNFADIPPSPQEFLPNIAYDPLTWEFQALLFALLGMILCAVGFAKGFTFIKDARNKHNSAEDISAKENGADGNFQADKEATGQSDDRGVAPNAQAKPALHIVTAYDDVLNQFRAGIGGLRNDVAEWYAVLDQKRRDMHGAVNLLREEKNRQACIECITHAFISEYNNRHAEKIDLQTVKQHREQRYEEPILVTPSDAVILEEAAALAVEWKKSGQANLEQRITEAQEEMITLWARYEPLVLAGGGERKSMTYGSGGDSVDTAPAHDGVRIQNENTAARES